MKSFEEQIARFFRYVNQPVVEQIGAGRNKPMSSDLTMEQILARGSRLMYIAAHPDDETFGTGGTLALYSRRGVDVHLVCATRGEVGEMDPALMGSFATIGDKRESELRCAAGTLGLTGVYFLGYRDSGMP